jgi:hypothetical protein
MNLTFLTTGIIVLMLIVYIFRVIMIMIVVNLLDGETTFKKTFILEFVLSFAVTISAVFGLIGNITAYAFTLFAYIIGYHLSIKNAFISLILVYLITTLVPFALTYLGLSALT